MILNSPTISGSLTVTGNIITSGSITISGSIASASYATNAELLDGLDSTAFATTGAYSATSASLYATSASLSATSGSLSATSGSLSATSGSLSATSGSLSTASGSFDTRVATIESKYATTGSNTFTSTQVVSGSILQSGSFTTTGTIIAQTINVQTVTSSVVYSSGSNVFGNSLGNSQTFTGSVLITGSLTIAGASSATSYSGTTIYGSTVACSPIGLFSGCVGIGTANPSAKLHINGGRTLAITGNENYSLGIGRESNTNAYYLGVHSTSSPNLLFSNNAGTTNMTLDYSGNLGLGVTPSAWATVGPVIQFTAGGFIGSQNTANTFYVGQNHYYNGSNFIYNNNGFATQFQVGSGNGSFSWRVSPSGTAGCAITFTQAMILNASGNLSIGNTNDTYKLDVSKDQNASTIASISNATSGTAAYAAYRIGSSANVWLYNFSNAYTTSGRFAAGTFLIDVGTTNGININTTNGSLTLSTDNTTRLTIGSTGATTLNGCPLGHLLYIQNSNSGYYSSTDYLDNAGTEKLIVGYANASTGNALASKAIIYGVSGVGLNFYTNGCTTAKMVIDTTGNVGIGTCVPSQQLSFGMLTNSATRTYTTDNQGTLSFYNLTTGNLEAYLDIASVRTGNDSTLGGSNIRFITQSTSSTISGCERMRISSTGYVGINVTSACKHLEVGGTIRTTVSPSVYYRDMSYIGDNYQFGSSETSDNVDFKICGGSTWSAGGNFRWWTQAGNTTPTERMRITSGGWTKITNSGTYLGVASPYHEIASNQNNNAAVVVSNSNNTYPYGVYMIFTGTSPNDSTRWFYNAEDTTATRFVVRSNGGIANYTANDVNLSDERVKKDISLLGSYWDKFKAIEIVKFKYKDQTHDDFNIGVIAQQVEEVAPEFVDIDGFGKTPEDGIPLKSIYEADLNHATIKVLQEAMAKIETQQCTINTLKTCLGIS